MYTTILIIVLAVFFLSAAIKILNEYERGVVFRLGRAIGAKGPGVVFLIPFLAFAIGGFYHNLLKLVKLE